MGTTSEERELVACRLRQAARWPYVWINDETLRELTGMKPSGLDSNSVQRECIASAHEIFMRLADLIDPEGDTDGSAD